MHDLAPTTEVLAGLVAAVRDDQLSAPTPCPEMSLAELLVHIDELALAFTAAATKTTPTGDDGTPDEDNPPTASSPLDTGWRTRIPQRLTDLAAAWRADAAWTGMTHAGGVDLPGEVAGVVALDEVLLHGWDVAAATGQQFTADPALAEAALGFVQATAQESPEGSPGLFGPPLPVPAEAPLLDRLVALSGRDPAWTPPA
ncbi:TIGR03086 family metal-binding protein [Ruania zhangjianzhongii]|uniref:TIGR03086 family metal-binding protein n=1 Tax=Ruania zhangjianzhongii TaxID=2603206 RepID=UPI0011CC39D9|nr:TIGR03086 family metal-binding protein [Ruania zhangjianzhongii]